MYLKDDAKTAKVAEVAERLKAIDYELIGITCGTGCPLTLKAADQLARMQRSIRTLRHLIELEGGIDLDGLTPRARPGGWSATLGKPRAPAGGGKRSICGK